MKVEYTDDYKIAYYNGERFTRDDNTGYYLSSRRVPEMGRRVRLHKYVWFMERGEIPKECQIHHIDENKTHNDIDNLECLTRHDHLSYHSSHRPKEMMKKFHAAGIEAAKDWHKSPEGRAWHKEHYKQFEGRLHMERSFVCAYCGKEFKNTTAHSRFCCNNCKSAWRRKAGLDDIEKICPVCGKTFMTNKYTPKKTCGAECGRIIKKARKAV